MLVIHRRCIRMVFMLATKVITYCCSIVIYEQRRTGKKETIDS